MEKIDEIWKDIPDYEGLYQVSNLGRIKRLEHKRKNNLINTDSTYKEHILKPAKQTSEYMYIVLCKNGKTKGFRVHRLVAQTFIPNPENKPQVNHIDTNKSNNNVNNLEWCSRSENMIHAYSHNLINSHTEKKRISQLNNIKIAREYLRRKNNAKNRNTI